MRNGGGPHSGQVADGAGVVAGWLRLAVASLMVAGLFSVLVAVARTAWLREIVGEAYFRVSLVAHVTFSLNVWTLSFAGALWALAAHRAGGQGTRKAGLAGLWLASGGAAVMAAVSAAGTGRPSLVDYIPVLEHPAYAVGMAAFFLGAALAAADFLMAVRHHPAPLGLELQALRMAAVAYLMALLALALAVSEGPGLDWPTASWAAGHILQVVNASVMVAAWLALLGADLPPGWQRAVGATLPLYLAPAVGVPALYVLRGPLLMGAVGTVTWAGLGVPTAVAWLAIVSVLVRQRRLSARLVPLVVSLVLLAVGGYAALMGLEGDTRVTAHYHGTVGAVTVAFMGLAYRLVGRLDMRLCLPRLARVQPLLYGGGLMLLIAGLFWASNFGGQRKVFEAFAQQQPGVMGPMGLFILGALLAVAGGVAFVLGMGISLVGGMPETPPAGARSRPATLATDGDLSPGQSSWTETEPRA